MLAQERCNALLTLSANAANAIKQSAMSGAQDTDSRQTAANMLLCLESFARDLVEFFDGGLADEDATGSGGYTLTMKDSTREWVFGLIAEQISFDLDAIVRAYTQRSLALDTDQPLAGKMSRLAISDALAYSILKPAIDANLFGAIKPTVFTYFQKSLRIRIIPYAPVVFVGVPFTAIRSASEYVAVAHEVGHFVYHHLDLSPLDNTSGNELRSLSRPSQASPGWYRNWLEEIVADVYGCLIAGTHIARSFQDLSLETTKPGLVFDDGHHPVPLIRPYIYTQTMQQLHAKPWGAANLDVISDDLDRVWQASIAGLGLDAQSLPIPIRESATAFTSGPATSGNTPKVTKHSLTNLREQLRTDVINKLLGSTFNGVLDCLAGTVSPGAPYLFQSLWQRPSEWTATPSEVTAEDLAAIDWDAPPALESSTRLTTLLSGKMDSYKQPGTETEEVDWIEILEFGGWIDQGPAGGVPHK